MKLKLMMFGLEAALVLAVGAFHFLFGLVVGYFTIWPLWQALFYSVVSMIALSVRFYQMAKCGDA